MNDLFIVPKILDKVYTNFLVYPMILRIIGKKENFRFF